jgi:hypothetical protein
MRPCLHVKEHNSCRISVYVQWHYFRSQFRRLHHEQDITVECGKFSDVPRCEAIYCHNSLSMLFNDAGGIETIYRRWSWMWGQLRSKKCQWKLKYSAKTRPSVTLSTTNFTWSDLGTNPGQWLTTRPVVSGSSYSFNKASNSHFEIYLYLLLNQEMDWHMQLVNGLSRSTSSSIYVDFVQKLITYMRKIRFQLHITSCKCHANKNESNFVPNWNAKRTAESASHLSCICCKLNIKLLILGAISILFLHLMWFIIVETILFRSVLSIMANLSSTMGMSFGQQIGSNC